MTAGPALDPDIRPLDAAGLATANDWAEREGWAPGLGDAPAFHAADPSGFLGLFEAGDLVATISAVRSGADFGFIGLFITRPDRRGLGFGKAIWQAGLARLAGRTVGLDGVVAQQSRYAGEGFVPAFRSRRFAGRAIAGTWDARITGFGPQHAAEVLAIDRRSFPAPRDTFLRQWLEAPRRSLVHVEGGRVGGFLALRACRDAHKIGPLFAESPAVAGRLFAAALALVPGERVLIDIPDANRAAVGMAEAAGMAPVFEAMRMYHGEAPLLPLDTIYGLTTLELG